MQNNHLSSLSLEDFVGLILELCGNLSSGGFSLVRLTVDLVEGDILFLFTLEEIHFDRIVAKRIKDKLSCFCKVSLFHAYPQRDPFEIVYLLMNEKPSSSVHEVALSACGVVTSALCNSLDLHFTGREKVDARNGLVSDGHLPLDCTNIESRETSEVGEQGLVWSAAGELDLWKFWGNAKEAEILLDHLHGASNSVLTCEHIDFINNY